MSLDPNRPAPLRTHQALDAEAATEILRMLTSDRAEPLLRCRADGGAVAIGAR